MLSLVAAFADPAGAESSYRCDPARRLSATAPARLPETGGLLVVIRSASLEKPYARLVGALSRAGILPCDTVQIGSEYNRLEHAVVPQFLPYYLDSFPEVLCGLNPNRCREGRLKPYRSGAVFQIPDLRLERSYTHQWIELADDEDPASDLHRILERKGLLSTATDALEREQLLHRVRTRNGDFALTQFQPTSQGPRPSIVVPRLEFRLQLAGRVGQREVEVVQRATGSDIELEWVAEPGLSAPVHLQSVAVRAQPALDLKTLHAALMDLERRLQAVRNQIGADPPDGQERGDGSLMIVDKGFDRNHPLLSSANYLPVSKLVERIVRAGSEEISLASLDEAEKHVASFLSHETDCDEASHGTHLWGLIAAPRVGLAPGRSIRTFEAEPPFHDLRYTLDNEPPPSIVNLSVDLADALSAEQRQGLAMAIRSMPATTVFVVAAGNDVAGDERRRDLVEADLRFPVSEHAQPNVLVVSALDESGLQLRADANRNANGSHVVHLAAPGHQVVSTCKEKKTGIMSGTSQAAALVSGAALRVRLGLDQKSGKSVKFRLQYTADYVPNLRDEVLYGRVNLSRALEGRVDRACPIEKSIRDADNEIIVDCREYLTGRASLGTKGATGFQKAEFVRLVDRYSQTFDWIRADDILRVVRTSSTSGPARFTVHYLVRNPPPPRSKPREGDDPARVATVHDVELIRAESGATIAVAFEAGEHCTAAAPCELTASFDDWVRRAGDGLVW